MALNIVQNAQVKSQLQVSNTLFGEVRELKTLYTNPTTGLLNYTAKDSQTDADYTPAAGKKFVLLAEDIINYGATGADFYIGKSTAGTNGGSAAQPAGYKDLHKLPNNTANTQVQASRGLVLAAGQYITCRGSDQFFGVLYGYEVNA